MTEKLPIHGFNLKPDFKDPLHVYGSDINKVKSMTKDPKGNVSLSDKIFITKHQILWAIKKEMATNLEDILARRTRCLFLNVLETENLINKVLDIMMEFLKKDEDWKSKQKLSFLSLTKNYKI
jgi:glycerol-3-phosphate dehydrogenase